MGRTCVHRRDERDQLWLPRVRQLAVSGDEVGDESLQSLLQFRQSMLDSQISGAIRYRDRVDICLNKEVVGCALFPWASRRIKRPHIGLHSSGRIRIAPSREVAFRDIMLRFMTAGSRHWPLLWPSRQPPFRLYRLSYLPLAQTGLEHTAATAIGVANRSLVAHPGGVGLRTSLSATRPHCGHSLSLRVSSRQGGQGDTATTNG